MEGVWKVGGFWVGLKPPWMAEEGRRWVQIGQICFWGREARRVPLSLTDLRAAHTPCRSPSGHS